MSDPELTRKLKQAASSAAASAGDTPDEQTAEAIKAGKRAAKKSRTSGIRADENEERLILTLTEEIDRLRTIYDDNQQTLESFSSCKVELAELKSPHLLRKSLVAGCSLMSVAGTLLIARFPQDGQEKLLTLECSTLFGAGLSLIAVSALFTFIFSLRA